METREKRTQYLLQETENISNVCLFHCGMLTDKAASTLQKAVKRYLLRQKYYVMIRCYNSFMEEKSKNAVILIKKFLVKLGFREKLEYQKFLKYREKRLRKIRKNLAMISLRKFWKKRKLSYRAIKDKLLRLKRKKTALANKEAYQKLLSSSSKKDKPINLRSFTKTTELELNLDDWDTDQNSESFIEQQRLLEEEKEREQQRIRAEAEAAFQKKVTICKQAHGINNYKEAVVIPFLQERELNENVSNSLDVHLYETTTASFNKSKKANKLSLPRIRNTTISSSPLANHKKLGSGEWALPPLLAVPGNYTAIRSPLSLPKNECFKFYSDSRTCRHKKTDPKPKYQPNPEHKHSEPDNRFMQYSTITFSQKKSEKFEGKEQRYFKNGRRNSDYTPGLDNTSFSPKAWQPIRLDKSILGTNLSTDYSKFHKRGISNPSILSLNSIIFGARPKWNDTPLLDRVSLDLIQYD